MELRVWPGTRGTAAIGTGVGLIVLALAILILVAHVNWWWGLNHACEKNDLGCHLASHLIMDLLLAGLGIWIFLHGEAGAARSWRKTVRRCPEWLFSDWLPNQEGLTGEAARASDDRTTGQPSGAKKVDVRGPWGESLAPIARTAIEREDLAGLVIDGLNDTHDAQILVGDSGAGKTVLLMVIAKQLAKQGQVPVAITLRTGSAAEIERSARAAFIAVVTGTAKLDRAPFRRARAKDHEQAEKWWNWLRRRSLITVLVDDLEKDSLEPALRVQALERAAAQRLRLIVASRSYGIPPDYRRGRTDVWPIPAERIVEDLQKIAGRTRASGGSLASPQTIRRLADSSDLGRTPYYLAIARVLADRGLFPSLSGARDARVALLDSYRKGLLTGRLAPASGLSRRTRADALHQLEAVAFIRILGVRKEGKIAAKAAKYRAPRPELPYEEVFDLARRLTILESRYDGEVHFAHPTTLAYFAARFVRSDSRGAWKTKLVAQPHLSPSVLTALILASAGDPEKVRWSCEELLGRVTAPEPEAGVRSAEDSQERLMLCAAAAEMLATLKRRPPEIIDALARAARSEPVVGQRLINEKRRVVAALSRLQAWSEIWGYARTHQEYPVRREASRMLAHAAPAHRTLITDMDKLIARADEERRRCPNHHDDDVPVIDELKPVAWMLPSIRLSADGRRRDRLDDLQIRLIDLSLDHRLTVQRGLEASVAQGFKLAAQERIGQTDEYALKMLDHVRGTPAFWYSRVMLAQALALQAIRPPQAPGSGDAVGRIDQHLTSLERDDPHPFVRETARLCRLAVAQRDWTPFVWTDVTELVTGVPRELSSEATRLAADIVLALNLNAHQNAEMRQRFGTAKALPACLAFGGSRDAILGYAPPPDDCPLDGRSEAQRARGSAVRCGCPYLYNSTDLQIDARRELSRAFCRHQRMHAKPPIWQEDVDVKALQRFWERMESLARF